MEKLLLLLVEVLNLEHSIPRGIIIRLTTELLVRCRTFLGRSPTPKPVHTECEFSLLGSPKRGDSVVYRFARAFMPLIVFCLSSVLPRESKPEARGRFKSAPGVFNRYSDGDPEIPDCARCPVRRTEPVAEQRRGSYRRVIGYKCLHTVERMSVLTQDCESKSQFLHGTVS